MYRQVDLVALGDHFVHGLHRKAVKPRLQGKLLGALTFGQRSRYCLVNNFV